MKKLTIYISCIIGLSLATSCKKFLDEKPVSASTDATFWKNERDANSAIAGGYALLRKSLNQAGGLSFFAYGDLPTDEYTTESFALTDVVNMRWAISIPSGDTWHPIMQLRRYDTYYSTIDQANRSIKFIPGIGEDKFSSAATKNHLLGEAYFLRAFNYFYMGRIWGGVPIVTESAPTIADAVDIPRSTPKQVMDQAQKDAIRAVELLGWSNPNPSDRAVRANKGAALALLAHIYAWTGDYQNCNAVTDQILTGGDYELVDKDNYLSIYRGKSTEGIFEIAQSDENEGSAGGIANQTLKAPFLTTNQGNAIFKIARTNLATGLFESANDKRYLKAFALTTSADPICIKYSNITYNSVGQNTIVPIAHNNIIVFRLADIMLLKAEACAAIGQFTAAREQLNKIRESAGLGDAQTGDSGLFGEIIDERGRELFLEGHRFYDNIRYFNAKADSKFSSVISGSDIRAGKNYWPLDPVLLVSNKKLTQTPFWSNKL